jgi:hypothetical protein
MKSECPRFNPRTSVIASPILAALVVFACMALSVGGVKAQDNKTGSKTNGSARSTVDNKYMEKKLEDFYPDNFDRPTQIDNEWKPLKPGTRYIYEGSTVEDDGSVVPHKVVITVTDLTKTIGGIESLVTWDLDYSDNELVEAELAFFAQDNEGNVWRMGEYPEEYEDGKLLAAPTWIHGIEGARAGIMMKAKPKLGTPSYSQGWGPAVNWTDRGQVDQMGQEVSVPAGNYKDVLVIAETSASETDAQQLKYWARGVGNVKVSWRGSGEKTKETLDLTKVEKLDAKAMAKVRAAALKMEKSAYAVSKNVYGKTPPLTQASGAEQKPKKLSLKGDK